MAIATESPKVDTAVDAGSMLMNAKQVAGMLQVSVRTIYRLADSGLMPRPQKLGTTLSRWSRAEIEDWVKAGMPSCRSSVAKVGAR